jgi:hypothetical protein
MYKIYKKSLTSKFQLKNLQSINFIFRFIILNQLKYLKYCFILIIKYTFIFRFL